MSRKLRENSGIQENSDRKRNFSQTRDDGTWIVLQYIEDDVIEARRAPRIQKLAVDETSKFRWRNGSYYPAKIIFIGSKQDAEKFAEKKHGKIKGSKKVDSENKDKKKKKLKERKITKKIQETAGLQIPVIDSEKHGDGLKLSELQIEKKKMQDLEKKVNNFDQPQFTNLNAAECTNQFEIQREELEGPVTDSEKQIAGSVLLESQIEITWKLLDLEKEEDNFVQQEELSNKIDVESPNRVEMARRELEGPATDSEKKTIAESALLVSHIEKISKMQDLEKEEENFVQQDELSNLNDVESPNQLEMERRELESPVTDSEKEIGLQSLEPQIEKKEQMKDLENEEEYTVQLEHTNLNDSNCIIIEKRIVDYSDSSPEEFLLKDKRKKLITDTSSSQDDTFLCRSLYRKELGPDNSPEAVNTEPYTNSEEYPTNNKRKRFVSTDSYSSQNEYLTLASFNREEMEVHTSPEEYLTNNKRKRLISTDTSATDEDYIPSENSSDESIEEIKKKKYPQEDELLHETTQEKSNIIITRTNNTKIKRRWDKKNLCIFCDKQISNLYKHILSKHHKESDVSKLLCMPKRSTERRNMLRKIRNAGNYKQNVSTLEKGAGIIIPSKRPSAKHIMTVDDYISCDSCFGLYKRDQIWRHKKKCCGKTLTKGRRKNPLISYAFQPVQAECTKELKENIFPQMKCDEVFLAIKNDSLILAYGSKLFKKNGKEKHLHGYIRNKLREIGRFLLTARSVDRKLESLNDVIDPQSYQTVIKAVKILGQYEEESGTFKNPSLTLKVGHALKHCANIKKSISIIKQDEKMRKCAEDFLQLCDLGWATEISSDALNTLHRRKWNNPSILPIARDIEKLQNFLREKMQELLSDRISGPITKSKWEELCKVTLATVILFNRRRAGEAQRLEVQTYENRDETDCQEEVLKSLTEFEKKLVKSLTLVETRGKRGRKVGILLKEEMRRAIEILIKHRKEAGVHEENPYIFARTNFNSLESHRAHEIIRKVATEANLEKPSLISSTRLRKHIATMSQLFNLKENELDTLASFLGHNIKVHREFYRLPEKTITLAKISKILIAAEQGKMHKYKGKSLDEISEEDVVASEEEDSESSDFSDSVSPLCSPEKISCSAEKRKNGSKRDAIKVIPTKNKLTPSKEINTQRKKKHLKNKTRIPWTEAEVAAVKTHLSRFFFQNDLPGKRLCEECKQKSGDILERRSWEQIKFFIYNRKKKNLKSK